MAEEFEKEISAFLELCQSHLFTISNFSDYWKQMIQVIGLSLASKQFNNWFRLKSKMTKLLERFLTNDNLQNSITSYGMAEFIQKKYMKKNVNVFLLAKKFHSIY